MAETLAVVTRNRLPIGSVGQAYSYELQVVGGTVGGGYTWAIIAGSLPASLSLAPTTGIISGTPLAADVGSYSITVEVTDSIPDTDTSVLTLSIEPFDFSRSDVFRLDPRLTELMQAFRQGADISPEAIARHFYRSLAAASSGADIIPSHHARDIFVPGWVGTGSDENARDVLDALFTLASGLTRFQTTKTGDAVDGVDTVIALPSAPFIPTGTMMFVNRLAYRYTDDFTIAGNLLSFENDESGGRYRLLDGDEIEVMFN